MKRLVDSLYVRLTLVLLVSLAAGFGTMYVLFRHHSEEVRTANFVRTVAVQVRLVEDFLRGNPDFFQHPIAGIILSANPDKSADKARKPRDDAGSNDGRALRSNTRQPEGFLAVLQTALAEELGHPVDLLRAPRGGVWVRLDHVPQGEMWLYFPSAVPHRPRVDPWSWGMAASCLVVLVGGMLLLWGVHTPLRRLEHAIRQVGRSDSPEVAVSGPREVRTLAEQFNNMVARLRQYDRDRAEMLAGVAHDLRTPSTRLRLQLEMENSPRRPAMLGNLDSIDAIVDQFLAFARGADPEPRVAVELARFVEDTVAPYANRGVVFDAGLMPSLAVPVMPRLLQRALVNLIENALEYGAPPVDISLQAEADGIRLRVRDHGPGIPAERLDSALQAFTRLDSSRGGKGHCGLGLAIVARVAALHGGSLRVGNADAGGLQADLHLPSSP